MDGGTSAWARLHSQPSSMQMSLRSLQPWNAFAPTVFTVLGISTSTSPLPPRHHLPSRSSLPSLWNWILFKAIQEQKALAQMVVTLPGITISSIPLPAKQYLPIVSSLLPSAKVTRLKLLQWLKRLSPSTFSVDGSVILCSPVQLKTPC